MTNRPLVICCLFLSSVVLSPAIGQKKDIPVFHAESRLVEVSATVLDDRGRYVDNLPQEAFGIFDNGEKQEIKNFEANSESLHCALLLDTTGSMTDALPRLQNSVVNFIDALGSEDSVAIFTFDEQMVVRQAFTTDKAAAKRAILRLQASGRTALFDALSEATETVSEQPGKKAIVVFTDGDDNASALNAQAAVNRAKKNGIPLYTIAEGDATQSPKLKNLLSDLSASTGGQTYEVKSAKQMEEVFQKISGELRHLYLLSYYPSALPTDGKWRKIDVKVDSVKDPRIRARDGYFPRH
jgi:Ca-activated chloride channel family protein